MVPKHPVPEAERKEGQGEPRCWNSAAAEQQGTLATLQGWDWEEKKTEADETKRRRSAGLPPQEGERRRQLLERHASWGEDWLVIAAERMQLPNPDIILPP